LTAYYLNGLHVVHITIHI